jgi:hypothetical protein
MEKEPMYVASITTNYLALKEEEEKYSTSLYYSSGHVAVKVTEQMDKDSGVSSSPFSTQSKDSKEVTIKDDIMLVDDDEDVTVLQSKFATLVPLAHVENKQVASKGVIETRKADDDEVDVFMTIKQRGKSI